jgi:hypothetical protein
LRIAIRCQVLPYDGEINRLETMTTKLRIRSELDWHDAA